MERNGERRPPRPRIELLTEPGSDREATAIVAALERFLAETAPAPPEPAPSQSPWLQAALREGVSRSQALAWGAARGLPSHPGSI